MENTDDVIPICPVCNDSECNGYCDEDDPTERCSNPEGHEWVYTGTQYGGDDERWGGEGRCYCCYCGADGDA